MTDPRTVLEAARFTATYWRDAIMANDTLSSTGMSHPVACILAALDGETEPVELGIAEDRWDEFRAALAPVASGATQVPDTANVGTVASPEARIALDARRLTPVQALTYALASGYVNDDGSMPKGKYAELTEQAERILDDLPVGWTLAPVASRGSIALVKTSPSTLSAYETGMVGDAPGEWQDPIPQPVVSPESVGDALAEDAERDRSEVAAWDVTLPPLEPEAVGGERCAFVLPSGEPCPLTRTGHHPIPPGIPYHCGAYGQDHSNGCPDHKPTPPPPAPESAEALRDDLVDWADEPDDIYGHRRDETRKRLDAIIAAARAEPLDVAALRDVAWRSLRGWHLLAHPQCRPGPVEHCKSAEFVSAVRTLTAYAEARRGRETA